MINGKRLKKLSLALATLLCGQHINAQWTITEPTTDYSGEVLLSNHSLKIMSNPLNFQGKLKGSQAYIDISPESYEEGTNILKVGGGRGSMYNLFLMTTEGDFNMAGKFRIGSSFNYPIFEIDRQRGDGVSISIKGERSYLPLNINASEISINKTNCWGKIQSLGPAAGIVINRGSDGNQGAQLTISPQPEDTNFDEWYYAITAKGYKGPVTTESDPFHPLLFEAKSFKFNTGNILIDGQIEKVKRIGIGSATAIDNALVYMDAYMTDSEYFIVSQHYNNIPFYVKTNGDVKTGTILEMGSNKGGHLIINSYDESGTIFTNETIGNVYRPMNFFASEYNFNLNAKQDTFKILGGGLWVDGEITCKDQLKVAEIDADQIKTKDINVEMNQAADYVFDEDYNLQSLNEVEAYVKSNKHLPGVPSASEMATEGMSVSQMSNLLLEKVEELTLHMIQMQKKMEQLQSENEALRTEMRGLKGE